MAIEIKPIEPHHIEPAKRVIVSVAEGIYKWGKSTDELLEMFADELTDMDQFQSHYFDRRGLFLVALDQGRVIGSVAIRPLDDKLCELKRMWLLEPYHGKGIGYSIMQQLLDFARQAGYERIRLETGTGQARAIGFYHRIGFQDVENPELDDDDLMMEMEL